VSEAEKYQGALYKGAKKVSAATRSRFLASILYPPYPAPHPIRCILCPLALLPIHPFAVAICHSLFLSHYILSTAF
jgi:hypothetical protein